MESWENLPLTTLLEIFRCLDLKSRRNASLSCKAWADAFKHPQLWRFLSLEFSNVRCRYICCKNEICYTVVSHCYQTLKHVIITWDQAELKLLYQRFVVILTDFFNSLIETCNLLQLKTIFLQSYNTRPPLHFVTSEKVNSLVISMARFLRSQKSLETFRIVWDLDTIHQALLIDAVTCCSAKSLLLLDLSTGFPFFPINCDPSVFQTSLQQFSNLKTLYISYENLGADTLDSVSNHCKTLRYLKLEVFGSYLKQVSGKPHLISAAKWTEIKEKLPDLVVTFNMLIYSSGYWPWELDLFQCLLPTTVPLYSFISCDTKFQRECIAYLLNFAGSLKYIELYCTDKEITSALLLISQCSKLKGLKLVGTLTIETIDLLEQLKLLQLTELEVVYLLFDTWWLSDEVKERRNSVNKDLKWFFKIIDSSETKAYRQAIRSHLSDLTNIYF